MHVDLSLYSQFVDAVTSDTSKNLDLWIARLRELDSAGINVTLLNTGATGLAGESGEFAEIVKKLNWHHKALTQEVLDHMKKELGDAIFYWFMVCHALNFDPNDVIAANVDKLKARYPEGKFSVYRADNRAEGDV